MKKTLITIGIIVVFLVIILAVVPLFFKQKLIEKTKTVINQNVNAKVEFTDLNLSLLRSFPKVTLELEEVVVSGLNEFQGDTLLVVPSIRTKTALRQLFNTDNIGIEEIILESPELNLISGKTGEVNWDIVPESIDEPEEALEEEGLNLQLEKILITDAGFSYIDRQSDMVLNIEGINFDISGEMYGTNARLQTDGNAEKLLLNYGGVNYISNMTLETTTLLDINYDVMDISIVENELLVNRLPLELTGNIRIPNDSMFFDLQIKTKESGFDNFLALIPPNYEEFLEDIETSGTASISGTIDGFYLEEQYPAFNLEMDVSNGNLHYEGLPEEIKNISADVSVTKPQGILDLMILNIKNAHAEVKNSPVNLTLILKNLVSDPYFDGALVGNVNFNDLKDALPLDSVNLNGNIDANLFVKGNYSAIENEEYNNLQSDGVVLLTNFIYDSPSLTQRIVIPEGKLEFSPKAMNLSGMNVKVGQSNLRLSGNITNYLNYALKDGTLAGNLQLVSPLVNLNELLRLQLEENETAQAAADAGSELADEGESMVFDIPQNVNITFQSDIKRVVFDRLDITDVKGLITAQKGVLALNDLSMNTLQGEMKMTGSYENTSENQPLFDFGFNVQDIDIPTAYKTLTGLQKMIPIAGHSQGQLSTNLLLKGQLNRQFKLIAPTVNGTGTFSTENLRIIESPLFNELRGLLNPDRLRNVAVDDFTAKVEIENGAIMLDPFSTQIAGQDVTISGNLNTQNLLDMRLAFDVERAAFGSDIQKILSILPGQENITMIPATVVINGPVGDPEVNVDLEEARKKITEEVKKSTKEDIQKSLNKLGEGLKNIFK